VLAVPIPRRNDEIKRYGSDDRRRDAVIASRWNRWLQRSVSGPFRITSALFPFNFRPRRSIIHARSIAAPRHRQPSPIPLLRWGKWSSATLWNLKSIFGAARPTIFASISRKHRERKKSRDDRRAISPISLDFSRFAPSFAPRHLSRTRCKRYIYIYRTYTYRERERERERERIDGVVQSPSRWKQRTGQAGSASPDVIASRIGVPMLKNGG